MKEKHTRGDVLFLLGLEIVAEARYPWVVAR